LNHVSPSLYGARVALLESRRQGELASLVRRHGGEPICVPAMREVERDCASEIESAIDVAGRSGALIVLATGAGLDRWFCMAGALGRAAELHAGFAQATVVCRGPKPIAVLKREGLTAQLRAAPPHTTSELLATLDSIDVRNRDVVFIHDGGGSRTVPEALARRGARVVEAQPYVWALPDDTEPLRALVRSIVAGDIDAVAFTTQIQGKHLFDIAQSIGLSSSLGEVLRGPVVVAAVGPTCAEALEHLGVPAHVTPRQPKMGALVLALASIMVARFGPASRVSD
jgi:uroporphyrinogen-III synthase